MNNSNPLINKRGKIVINQDDNLDNNLTYCWMCYKEGVINLIPKDKKLNCNHNNRNFYRIEFCNNCNIFTLHRGIRRGQCAICYARLKLHTPEAIALAENTRRISDPDRINRLNTKEAIRKRVETNKRNGVYEKITKITHTPEANAKREATMRANGEHLKRIKRLNSPEAHERAWKTQQKLGVAIFSEESRKKSYKTRVENGSFDLFLKAGNSPETVAKAHRTRVENGSFKRFLDAAHSPEARIKANKTFIKSFTQNFNKMFKTDEIETIIKYLSTNKKDTKKYKNAFFYCSALGNQDFLNGIRINKIECDKKSKAAVYAIKIKSDYIYIGESLNWKERAITHERELSNVNNKYYKTKNFINHNMIRGVDYEIIPLATPPKNMNKFEKKRWMSIVECQMIEKYKTYEKGNNKTGTF